MRDRNYEQGGVVSFVVIALTVATLLIGGIWLAKQQGQSVQNTSQTSSTQSGEDKATAPSDATSGSSNKDQSTSTDTGTSAGSNSGSSSTTTDETATDTVASTGPSDEQLPSTGIGDITVTLLSVSVIVAGLYAYRQSHKQLRHSALK